MGFVTVRFIRSLSLYDQGESRPFRTRPSQRSKIITGTRTRISPKGHVGNVLRILITIFGSRWTDEGTKTTKIRRESRDTDRDNCNHPRPTLAPIGLIVNSSIRSYRRQIDRARPMCGGRRNRPMRGVRRNGFSFRWFRFWGDATRGVCCLVVDAGPFPYGRAFVSLGRFRLVGIVTAGGPAAGWKRWKRTEGTSESRTANFASVVPKTVRPTKGLDHE